MSEGRAVKENLFKIFVEFLFCESINKLYWFDALRRFDYRNNLLENKAIGMNVHRKQH